MDDLSTVAFEAHHAELNHHRRHEITVGRDLFDAWTVSIRYPASPRLFATNADKERQKNAALVQRGKTNNFANVESVVISDRSAAGFEPADAWNGGAIR